MHHGAATNTAGGAGAFHLFQVPRACLEAVWRCREGADRTDLHGVARKIRAERFVGKRHDLRVVAPTRERDQWVASHFASKASAAIAQNAALTIQEHQVADGNRLFVVALFFDVTALAGAMRKRLVLQRALPAFVAHRTIQRMISKQQLEHTFLRALGRLRSSGHHLAFGHRSHARHHERLAARAFYFDDALATHADCRHAGVIAKVGNERTRLLARIDEQFTRLGLDCAAVNGDADCGLWCCGVGHGVRIRRVWLGGWQTATQHRQSGGRVRCSAQTQGGNVARLMQLATLPMARADKWWSVAEAKRCLG